MDEQRIETDRLALEAQKGSQEAKIALYERVAPLLEWEARKKSKNFTSLNLDDVKQELYIVFEKSIQYFNPDTGAFTTLLINSARRRTNELVDEHKTVRIKRTFLTYKVFQLQGKPLPKNAEKIFELAKAKIFELHPGKDEKQIDPLEIVNLHERAEIVRNALKFLPERDRAIVKTYYGIDTTPAILEQIGAKYGITRERVRQIINRAKRKLKIVLELYFREGSL